ncbi:MAG: proline--tRNA ligase [Chlamydiae bacterium GWC2_50_10]|nr:MAG: proline--tRNA ligase [Chlamydiae bacterium GWC2_50_10]
MTQKTAISFKREENYAEWYQEAVKLAELAEHAPVRGCMVIKPWGYALWEKIQRILDEKFKETGHLNAYFPLFIPLSYFEKEAEHVEGFAKECAVVTHHRLERGKEGGLVPAGKLEEPLIVRPTSEMIIGEMFSRGIHSYRDLPLLLNQWANVVRWEMRTRLFLRTAEFLWQEGHTAHATGEEAEEETLRMLEIYTRFVEDVLAIPVIRGKKGERERFPGAIETYTLEAMMQDRKALQCCTSHFLGQNFAKAAGIRFFDRDEKEKYAWTTSWGLTTRMIGALVMVHGDDDGLILPPRIASSQLVILPVIHKEESKSAVLSYAHALAGKLRHLTYQGALISVFVDEKEIRGGEKTWGWIKKGVPMRIEVGPREVESRTLSVYRRDRPHKEALTLSSEEFLVRAPSLFEEIQRSLFQRALSFRDRHTRRIDQKEEFLSFFTPQNREAPEIHGGFASVHFCQDPVLEDKIQEELGVTLRCLPLDGGTEEGRCIFTGRKSPQRVLFAKAY